METTRNNEDKVKYIASMLMQMDKDSLLLVEGGVQMLVAKSNAEKIKGKKK